MPPRNKQQRQTIRAALKIHEHLLGCACEADVKLPIARWQELAHTAQQLRHVQRRGWSSASAAVAKHLAYVLRRLGDDIEIVRQNLPPQSKPTSIASASSILADLQALHGEFEKVSIDLREKTISARTLPIELEYVEFGPFKIVLHWDRMDDDRAYDVIALEPNAADERPSVTHPHVRDDELCEGEGKTAIRSALTSGRLLDFFLLVRQILQTYNAGSPHVSISDWHGVSCAACGHGMPSDDSSSCDRCDDPMCEDCSNFCETCERNVCTDCTSECAGCERRFCNTCLDEADGASPLLCKSCLQKTPGETDDESESNAEPAADAVCLGETVAAA